MKQPVLSIITPVYNREDCILKCLTSVKKQTITNCIEHIVINDGSIDNTKSIIEEFASQNNYVKFIDFNINRGTNAARNAGIRIAKGQFTVFLDSDDIFLSNAIETIFAVIEKYQGYSHYLFPQECQRVKFAEVTDVTLIRYEDWVNRKVEGDFVHVISSNILKQFPFEEEIRIYEALTLLRVYKAEEKMLCIPKEIALRDRGRKDSVTNDMLLFKKNAIKYQFFYIYTELIEHNSVMNRDILIARFNKLCMLGAALGEKSSIVELSRLLNINNTYSKSATLVCSFKLSFGLREIIKTYSWLKFRFS